ncbi:MAG: BLUF domain-containing protein [Burkholderiales bacterium]|nr:BLUF domain-containing protein [Burkholderiales bacterium]
MLVSVSRVHGSVMQQLLLERNIASQRGREPGVQAALLHASGWFVMWLEGQDEAAIDRVIQRYRNDARHAHQRELHRSRGPASLVEPLTVAATQGPDTPADFARRIYAIKKEDQRAPVQPASIWEQLSAPSTLPQKAGSQPGIARLIGLVASDDPGSVEIIRKLGERFARPVVYQRFAAGARNSPDVGGAYVDIDSPCGAMRVQLLSRRALANLMVQRSLARLHSLALLLGARPRAAIELAGSVAAFVDAAAIRPAIQLVTQCPDIAGRVGALLSQGQRAGARCAVVQVAESRLAEYLQQVLQGTQACPQAA